MLGSEGLKEATKVAILNANYIKYHLKDDFKVKYTNKGYVAHECILDTSDFGKYNIKEKDIAKRLMDYGFHAPTMSWPVVNSLMVEPTESEPLSELNRFITSMKSIRNEIRYIIDNQLDQNNNVLKNSPHNAKFVTKNEWNYNYSRQLAAYPLKEM